MRCRLATSVYVVVTCCTAARYYSGVRKTGGFPGGCGMASVTGLGCRNMRHIFGLGVDGNISAAMAARAVTGGSRPRGEGVAHRRRSKSRVVRMALIALRRSGNMVGRLAHRVGAVMAGRTNAGGGRIRGGMIVGAGRPGGRRIVASIALCSSRNMSHGLHLRILGEIGAAVTGRALTGQPGMTHHRGRPGRITKGMASGTLGGRRDVRGRFGKCVDRDITTVVARRAVTGGKRPRRSSVTHNGRPEGIVVVMAGRTLGSGWNMGGRLAQRCRAIMTSGTLADCVGIVGINGGSPG